MTHAGSTHSSAKREPSPQVRAHLPGRSASDSGAPIKVSGSTEAVSGRILAACGRPLDERGVLAAGQHDVAWLDSEVSPTFRENRPKFEVEARPLPEAGRSADEDAMRDWLAAPRDVVRQ